MCEFRGWLSWRLQPPREASGRASRRPCIAAAVDCCAHTRRSPEVSALALRRLRGGAGRTGRHQAHGEGSGVDRRTSALRPGNRPRVGWRRRVSGCAVRVPMTAEAISDDVRPLGRATMLLEAPFDGRYRTRCRARGRPALCTRRAESRESESTDFDLRVRDAGSARVEAAQGVVTLDPGAAGAGALERMGFKPTQARRRVDAALRAGTHGNLATLLLQ